MAAMPPMHRAVAIVLLGCSALDLPLGLPRSLRRVTARSCWYEPAIAMAGVASYFLERDSWSPACSCGEAQRTVPPPLSESEEPRRVAGAPGARHRSPDRVQPDEQLPAG